MHLVIIWHEHFLLLWELQSLPILFFLFLPGNRTVISLGWPVFCYSHLLPGGECTGFHEKTKDPIDQQLFDSFFSIVKKPHCYTVIKIEIKWE